MTATTLIELRTVSLDPSVHGGVVNSQAAFLGQLFYILVTEGVSALPMYTVQDDCGEKRRPFEQGRLGHEVDSLEAQVSYPTMRSVFATKP